jgi:soluble lytic murein transglycosylase-like protein
MRIAMAIRDTKSNTLSWMAGIANRTLPKGTIILLIIGLTLILASGTISVLTHRFCMRINEEDRLYRQHELFQKHIENYETRVDELKHQVFLRQRLESRMLAAMDRFGSPLNPAQRKAYAKFSVDEARRRGLDPTVVISLVAVESRFDPKAVSNKGAVGMTQLLPWVAHAFAKEAGVKWRGLSTLFDPYDNTRIGLYYLNTLTDRFGSLPLALEAYNNGPTALEERVERGTTPSRYSAKVLLLANRFRT